MRADDMDLGGPEEFYNPDGPVCRHCGGPVTVPIKPVGNETPRGDWCQSCYNDIYTDEFGFPASVLGDMIARWEISHDRRYR